MFDTSARTRERVLITPESIAAGIDRELSRVTERGRAMIFLRTAHGSCGLASCKLGPDGVAIEKIYGVWFLGAARLGELDHAVVEARRKFAEPDT